MKAPQGDLAALAAGASSSGVLAVDVPPPPAAEFRSPLRSAHIRHMKKFKDRAYGGTVFRCTEPGCNMPHVPLPTETKPEVEVLSRPRELRPGESPFGPLAKEGASVKCDHTCAVKNCEEECCLELYHDHGSPEAHLCRQHDTLRMVKKWRRHHHQSQNRLRLLHIRHRREL